MTWLWPIFLFLLLYAALTAAFQGVTACARRWLPSAHPWRRKLAGDLPHRLAILTLDGLQWLAALGLLGGAILLTFLYS